MKLERTSFSCLFSCRRCCIICSFSMCSFLISCCASWYCCVMTVMSASSRAFFADRALKASFRSSNASCIFFTFRANDLFKREGWRHEKIGSAELLVRFEHRLFLKSHALKNRSHLTIFVRVSILQLSSNNGHLV